MGTVEKRSESEEEK